MSEETEDACALILTIEEDVSGQTISSLAEILGRIDGVISVDSAKNDFRHQAAVRKAQNRVEEELTDLLSDDIELNGTPDLNGG